MILTVGTILRTYRSFLATPGGVLLSCSRHADVFQEPQVQLAMQEAGPKRHSRAQGADAAMLYSRQLIFSGLADFFVLTLGGSTWFEHRALLSNGKAVPTFWQVCTARRYSGLNGMVSVQTA